jgi:hypothetical protein
MLESMLQKPSSNSSSSSSNSSALPPETALALLSFLQHEYPLGGAVETRFLRLFPILCDRIFGPVLSHSSLSTSTSSSNSSTSTIATASASASTATTNTTNSGSSSANIVAFRNEELQLVQLAWLFQKSPWRNMTTGVTGMSAIHSKVSTNRISNRTSSITANSSNNNNNRNSNGSSGRISNSSLRSSSNVVNGNSRNTFTSSTLNGNRKLDNDPVVQLLSPTPMTTSTNHTNTSSSTRTVNSNPTLSSSSTISMSPSSFIQIIESTSITSRQLKNVRLPFPFMELSPNLQQTFIQHILNHNPGVQQSNNAERTWNMLHYPIQEQNDLRRTLQNYLQNQQQQHQHNQFGVNPNMSNNNTNNQPSQSIHQDTFDHNTFHHQQYPPKQSHLLHHHSLSSPSNINTMNTNNVVTSLSDIKLTIDLWEYYMILFLRHGVYYTKMKNILQKQFPNQSNMYLQQQMQQQPFGERVYLLLFKKYCEYYIPYDFHSTKHHVQSSLFDNKKEDDYKQTRLQQQRQGMRIPMEDELIMNHEQKSELFIRLIVEYFFDFNHVYPTTKESLENNLMNMTSGVLQNNNNGAMENDGLLAYSYELSTLLPIRTTSPSSSTPSWISNAITSQGGGNSNIIGSAIHSNVIFKKQQNYNAVSKQVQKNIRTLIEHVLCDPAIKQLCYSGDYKKKVSASPAAAKGTTNTDNVASVAISWPLSRSQTLLQPSFYNYLRTSLRYGAVHVRNSSFYTALDVWLTWLEPWNVVTRKYFVPK